MLNKILDLDTKLSQWVYSLQPNGDIDNKVIEQITRIFGVIPAYLIGIIFTKNIFITTAIFAGIVIFNYFIIENFIKKIVKRERPAFTNRKSKTYSFPSTHSTTMGLIAGQFLILQSLYNNPMLAFGIFIIWGIFTIFSRVLYGYHFLLDIIAGFALGLILSLVFLLGLPLVK